MATTPTALPDTPAAVGGNTLDNGFGTGVAHSVGLNQMIDDILQAWTKLGIGAAVPTTAGDVLYVASAGATAYGPKGLTKLADAVGTGASGVLTFSSIPATFRNLRLVIVGRSSASAITASVLLALNGNATAADYDYAGFEPFTVGTFSGFENIGASANIYVGSVPAANSTANLHSSAEVLLPEYANTGIWKPVQAHGGGQTNAATGKITPATVGGVFESLSAISALTLTLSTGNWTTTSRCTLYGEPA